MAKATLFPRSVDALKNLITYVISEIANLSYDRKYDSHIQESPKLKTKGSIIADIERQFRGQEGDTYPTIDYSTSWHKDGCISLHVSVTPNGTGVQLSMNVSSDYWYKTFVQDCDNLIYQNLKANDHWGLECNCQNEQCRHKLIGTSSLTDLEGIVAKLKETIAACIPKHSAVFQSVAWQRTDEQMASVISAREAIEHVIANSVTCKPATTWYSIAGDVEVLKVIDAENREATLAFTFEELLNLDRQFRCMQFGARNAAERSQVNSATATIAGHGVDLPWNTINWIAIDSVLREYKQDSAFTCQLYPCIYQNNDGHFEMKIDVIAMPDADYTELPSVYLETINASYAYTRGEGAFLQIQSEIQLAKSNDRLNGKRKKERVRQWKERLRDLELVPTPLQTVTAS